MEPTTTESVYQQTETVYRANPFQKLKLKNPLKVPLALKPVDRTVRPIINLSYACCLNKIKLVFF